MTAIKLKRSAVASKIPATTDLELGELAINTHDGNLFLKKDDGAEAIVQLSKTGHAHAIGDVTGLQTALDAKAASSHTHPLSQISDWPADVSATELGYLDGVTSAIQTQLNGKAASSHSHATSDVTGLDAALAAKAPLASPTFTGTATFAGAKETVEALSGTAVALSVAGGTIKTHTLTGATAYSDSLNSGEKLTLVIAATNLAVTWPTITWLNNGGVAPTLSETDPTAVALAKVGTTLYGALVGDGT